MAKLQIWRSNMDSARERCRLSDDEQAVLDDMVGKNTGNVPVDVERLPLAFARALLEDPKLKPNQRAVLALRVHGLRGEDLDVEGLYAVRVSNPVEFGSVFSAVARRRANAEMYWNGRWYPVVALAELQEDEHKLAKNVVVRVTLGMGRATHDVWLPVDPAIFGDAGDDPAGDGASSSSPTAGELTVLQVLERLGFRRLQTPAAAHNLRLVRSERLAAEPGAQVWVRGAVLALNRGFWFRTGPSELPLGTADMPRRAVVEPTLEVSEGDGFGYGPVYRHLFSEKVSRLPLVRVFSQDLKAFVFADVDDLEPYDYDAAALDRLYLPPDMKGVLRRVFETPVEQLFGDLIRGKHGGTVILACGRPGVGKTLTAEVYAEMARRPLYVLEFGEMGTNVEQIEHNLQRVFARVVRWRAVLQFDECEIFLGQRGGDLERSAIVGIFLRMLDYYEGLLFLTSNRPEVLDDAIRSRVMLRLDYPDLDAAGRAHVWRTMFSAAGMTLTGGTFEELGAADVNGRQIRNLVRLARILHPERTVTRERVTDLLRYGSR